jgi:tRNA(fMet)-specific endonuclease VapC
MPPSRRRRALEQYPAGVLGTLASVLPYNPDAAEWHAAERARLVGLGLTPSYLDGQIAAIAVVNGFILVTRTVRDFEQFRELQVEDWFA